MSKLAIVILNWNGKHLLETYLPSVINYSPNTDIYVADNASTDNSVSFVKEQFPTVNIIQNDCNGGFAKGYNDALKHVEADIFCLLNSDVQVVEGWLDPILDAFNTLESASIIQPKILDLKKPSYFEYAGAGGGFIDQLGYPFCRGRIFQVLEKDEGQYNDTREIFWATGACMFIKSSVFNTLGGFDEDYFAHQEEVDLCWRAKNLGHKIWYVGASSVMHLGGSTLNNMNPRKTFLNFRNSLLNLVKNIPLWRSLLMVLIRLCLDGIAGLRFIAQGRPRHCLAILKAHLSFYTLARKMYKKRQNKSFLKKYYITKSIVWDHFVNRISYFNILVKD